MAYENIRFSKYNMAVVDNNFFMFDHTYDKLVQKSDGGDTVFEYPLDVDLTSLYYDDNFTLLDDDKWDFGGSSYSIVPTGLRLIASASTPTVYSEGFNTGEVWWMSGAFDIQVFFNIVSYDNGPSYWDAPTLRIRGLSTGSYPNNRIQVSRRCNGTDNHDYTSWHYNGSTWTTIGNYATTPSDSFFSEGGLRLYRSGSTVTTYYYNGESWVSLGSTTASIGDIDVRLRTYSSSWNGNPNVTVDIKRIEARSFLGAVLETHYDGTYFWTLQLMDASKGIVIRKWLVEDYLCKLQQNFAYRNTDVYTYYSRAFGVEHYLTEFSNDVSSGNNIITMDEYYDSVVSSGTVLSLGPNTSGEREDVTVSGIVGSDVILESNLQYSYNTDDQISMNRSLLVFNDYDGIDGSTGSLIRFSSLDGSYISSDVNDDYQTVYAATFSRFQNILPDYPDAQALVYIKGTNAKLRNMSDLIDLTDATSVNDNFTGPDASLPNTTRWSITNGNPRVYNNALFCSLVINGTDEITSNYELVGDFDVQVSGTVGGYEPDHAGADDFTFKHRMGLSFPHNDDHYCNAGFYYVDDDPPDSPPTSGLIREYTFESYSGSTLFDTSGTGSNATMSSINITSGLVGNGGQINSNTDYISLSSAVGGSIISISCFFYYSASNGSWATLFCRNGGTYHHMLMWSDGSIGFYNGGFFDSGYDLSTGNWYHLVLIKNGTNSKLYVDKSQKQNSNSSFNNASWPMGVIANYSTGSPSQGPIGIFDQIRIYNRELTTGEIEALYEEGYYTPITNNINLYTAVDGVNDTVVPWPGDSNDYKLRMTRTGSSVSFYYKTSTSGIFDTSWTLLDTNTMYAGDCTLNLGLYSSYTTVSGAYHDDLIYNSGYIKYPVSEIPYYGIMNIDNVRANGSTLITVYDISIVGDSLYRLQDEATYYGVDNDWGSQYNYQVSPIRPFIDFITVGAYPEILPATGRNVSQITAVVLDQYGEGAVGKPVHFTDDDDVGFITIPDVDTDYFHGTGEAKTNYMSGVDLRIVTVQGTATQYD